MSHLKNIYNYFINVLIIIKNSFTGTETECINLGSYNYLGFAESTGNCAEQSIETLKKDGCASGSTRLELGNYLFIEFS